MKQRRSSPVVDLLPELYPYRDDGCEVSPSCLDCPLPQCKFDDPGWFQRERRKQRDQEVLKVRGSEGLSVPQLAYRFGVSQRTVFRILRRARGDDPSLEMLEEVTLSGRHPRGDRHPF